MKNEETNNIDLVKYEKYLIKKLFTDVDARDKIFPFLDPSYFDDSIHHQNIIREYQAHYAEYQKHPTPREFVARIDNDDLFKTFREVISYDVSDISQEFLYDRAGEFFRQKMLMQHTFDIMEGIKDNGTNAVTDSPDKIREALSFSFDTHIGLDFGTDAEKIYDSLHEDDNVISTGLSDFDGAIKGGFHEKTLSLFIAETNLGKSLIMGAVGVNAFLQNKNVLYVTLEMSETKISERIMANAFDLDIASLDKLSKEQFIGYYDNFKEKVESKFVVKEYPTRGANTNTIRNLVKELYIKKNFKPDIIFVDYLGIMTTNAKNANENTNITYKTISEELRGLAVDLGLPIVSANQTNREGMGVSDIGLTQVADSIGQTMTADIIIGVTQTEEMNQQGLYGFKLLKNRYGGKYSKFLVRVNYQKMRLEDAPQNPDDGYADATALKIDSATNAVVDALKFNRRAGRDKIIEFD